MKEVQGSSRRRYAAVVSMFLIVAGLLTSGMTCGDTYQLVISSTGRGAVTVPGEGTRTYDSGTVVELVATPDEGYEFRGWTGDTEHIADPESASTTITMRGNYYIEANFRGEDERDPLVPPDSG